MQDDTELRRRTLSPDTLRTQAARRLVAQTQRKLGDWQAETVKLEVMSHRPDSTPRLRPALERLLGEIQSEQLRLADCLAGADPDLLKHSSVLDTERSLAVLAERLSRMLAATG